ncbi:MAG: hypothetical protein O3B31_15360 [Chloroflexi bacterium]|nr:hypothetical protein [Chloroflexota bacterium]MDA1004701.1 hypothetical protein [Chloroflexota bacterium]
MTTDRSANAIVGEIRGLLDDDPQWVDFEGRDDQLVGWLLGEGRARHIPRELLWEYAAVRWQELYGPEEDEPGAG